MRKSFKAALVGLVLTSALGVAGGVFAQDNKGGDKPAASDVIPTKGQGQNQ